MRKEKHRSRDHSREKSIVSTLAGGAGGAYLGHEIGGGAIGAVGGLLAGALGARQLEKRHERLVPQTYTSFEWYHCSPTWRRIELDSLTDGFHILDTSANALETTAILLALDTARLPAR